MTQRGNRRQDTFFCDEDYQAYLELMSQWCDECGVHVWAYCLMPNHVHLIAVPAVEAAGEGLLASNRVKRCMMSPDTSRRFLRRVVYSGVDHYNSGRRLGELSVTGS